MKRIKRLLSSDGVDRNNNNFSKKVDSGSTATKNAQLIAAVLSNNLESVRQLIVVGANVNAKDRDGNTALMLAVMYEYFGVVLLLINYGANVNVADENSTPALIWLVRCAPIEVIRVFLDNGVDINAADKDGKTALMEAARCDKIEVACLLLKCGADIDAKKGDDNTALMEAVRYGRTEIVSLFLDYSANINIENKAGYTALILAAGNCYTEIVELLFAGGADINIRNKNGKTALMEAVEKENIDVIKVFLQLPEVDLNIRDNNNETVLHIAANIGSFKAMVLLIFHEIQKGETVANYNKVEMKNELRPSSKSNIVKLILEYILDDGIPDKYIKNPGRYCDDICQIVPCIKNELINSFHLKLIDSWLKIFSVVSKLKKQFFNKGVIMQKEDDPSDTLYEGFIQDLPIMIVGIELQSRIKVLKMLEPLFNRVIKTKKQIESLDNLKMYKDNLISSLAIEGPNADEYFQIINSQLVEGGEKWQKSYYQICYCEEGIEPFGDTALVE